MAVSFLRELPVLLLSASRRLTRPSECRTSFDGTPPSHFYGELVKTSEGCEMLDESEHFLRFCDTIREHADRELDPDCIAQLKSVLWAVVSRVGPANPILLLIPRSCCSQGHIGATENGLVFIEDEYILADIVEIACTSPVYSLRG